MGSEWHGQLALVAGSECHELLMAAMSGMYMKYMMDIFLSVFISAWMKEKMCHWIKFIACTTCLCFSLPKSIDWLWKIILVRLILVK